MFTLLIMGMTCLLASTAKAEPEADAQYFYNPYPAYNYWRTPITTSYYPTYQPPITSYYPTYPSFRYQPLAYYPRIPIVQAQPAVATKEDDEEMKNKPLR